MNYVACIISDGGAHRLWQMGRGRHNAEVIAELQSAIRQWRDLNPREAGSATFRCVPITLRQYARWTAGMLAVEEL